MRLSEPIERPGFFWLPQDPEHQVPGILRVSKSGRVTLEISYFYNPSLTLLNNPPLGHSQSGREWDRICGIAGDSRVTLDACSYVARNTKFGGISTATIKAEHAFLGVNYGEGEEIAFSRVRFTVEGLDEWLSVSGFETEVNWEERESLIAHRLPSDISLDLSGDIRLTFTFTCTLPSHSSTESHITQKAHISLQSKELLPTKDFLDLIFKLRKFLCFSIDKNVAVDSITGFSPGITGELTSGGKYEVPIDIYYRSPLEDFGRKPEVRIFDMLFSYRDIAGRIEEVLPIWLEAYGKSEPAFNMYFASTSGSSKFLEWKFLSLIQGIEVLHRRSSSETEMKRDEFEGIVHRIVEIVPKDRKGWIESRLTHANELSLRKRIKSLIEPWDDLYGNSQERRSFISKVVDTRNYLTHYDSKSSQSELTEGEDLWKLCMKLEALFQMHFLQLIGMDIDSIKSMVNENRTLRNKLGIEDPEASEGSV